MEVRTEVVAWVKGKVGRRDGSEEERHGGSYEGKKNGETNLGR